MQQLAVSNDASPSHLPAAVPQYEHLQLCSNAVFSLHPFHSFIHPFIHCQISQPDNHIVVSRMNSLY